MEYVELVPTIIDTIITTAGDLLSQLPVVFTTVVDLLWDNVNEVLTPLGSIIVATAGFALAYAGIRFVFNFMNRLLNKSRAGK